MPDAVAPSTSAPMDSVTGLPTAQRGTSGAAWVAEQGNIAALENPSSPTNNYVKTRPGNIQAVIISTTSAVAIGGSSVANDRMLFKVQVHTALTGTCVIAGFVDETGAAKSYTIPAAFVGERDFGGAKNAAGALTVTCSNAADDDKVCVTYGVA